MSDASLSWPEVCILGASAARFARIHATAELERARAGEAPVDYPALRRVAAAGPAVRPGRARVLESPGMTSQRLSLGLIGSDAVLVYDLERDADNGWRVSTLETVVAA